MTRREQLTENYEDALFALLMEKAAEEEGESLLEENERLRTAGGAAPSPALDGKINDVITRAGRRAKAANARYYVYRVTKIAAIASLVAALLLSTAFLASRSGKDTTLEFENSVIDDHTVAVKINKKTDDPPSENGFMGIEAGWLPDGYELVDSERRGDSVKYIYKNSDGDTVTVQSYLALYSLSFFVDTDKTALSTVEINGSTGRMMIDDSINIMFQLGQTERVVSVYTSATALTPDELIKIAENLTLI